MTIQGKGNNLGHGSMYSIKNLTNDLQVRTEIMTMTVKEHVDGKTLFTSTVCVMRNGEIIF